MSGKTPAAVIGDPGPGFFGIAAARWHEDLVERLLEGASAALVRAGIGPERILIRRVPGAFELPLAASLLAKKSNCRGVIALGAVIRGDTPHFEFVARAATEGLSRVSLDTGVPVGFGMLTADSEEQAWARAGGSEGNKGEEAALAAIEMALLLSKG